MCTHIKTFMHSDVFGQLSVNLHQPARREKSAQSSHQISVNLSAQTHPHKSFPKISLLPPRTALHDEYQYVFFSQSMFSHSYYGWMDGNICLMSKCQKQNASITHFTAHCENTAEKCGIEKKKVKQGYAGYLNPQNY